MAFPTDWGRRCALVIQSSQVTDNEVDYPLLVTEDTLPSEIFDADGSYPALNGGGDIRFSSDEAGDTQLACEIEKFVTDNDPANGKAAIWVKIPSLNSSSNTTIYIWYHKSGESQPAEDNAYGKENVWDSNFVMVQHMNQIPDGTAGEIVDSTSNDNDGTTSGMDSADQVAGQIDGSLDFDGANDHVSSAHSSSLDISEAITISAFVYMHSAGSYPSVVTKAEGVQDWGFNFQFAVATRKINLYLEPANEAWTNIGNTAVPLNTQTYIVAIYDGLDNIKYYYNGNPDGSFTVTGGGIRSNIGALLIGKRVDGFIYDGLIDEVRVSNIVRSAGWIATEYNNQNAPGTFLIEGTPETPEEAPSIFIPRIIIF